MNLRRAVMDDASILLAWRNDPETRVQSRNTEPIDFDHHVHWLAGVLADPSRVLCVAEDNGVPVGSNRVDFGPRDAEVSWVIAPDFRGRGLGAAMLAAVVKVFDAVPLRAEIRVDNAPSRRIAERCGFVRVESSDPCFSSWRRAASPTGRRR